MRFNRAAVLTVVGSLLAVGAAMAQQVNVSQNVSVTVQQVTNVNNAAGMPVNGCVNYASGRIYVTGMGVAADGATSNVQRKATAKTAAVADCLRNLVSIVSGVHVSNETLTVLSKLEKDVVATGLSAFVRAGRTFDAVDQLPPGINVGPLGIEKDVDDAGKTTYLYTIAMEVPLYGASSAAQAIYQHPTKPQTPAGLAGGADPNAASQFANVPAVGVGTRDTLPGDATGVIIDCTGLPIQPAMAPNIFSDATKKVIYPTANITTQAAVEQGVVGYATSVDEAKKTQRVGANPMIVRAIAMPNNGPDGGKTSFDVVVSAESAKAIADANATGKFLERCAVVFVLKP